MQLSPAPKLNVARLREPFDKPARNLGTPELGNAELVRVTGVEAEDELAKARLGMMKAALTHLPDERVNIGGYIGADVAAGREPLDAIYIGVMRAIDAALKQALDRNPQFQHYRVRRQQLLPQRFYEAGTTTVADELRAIINHGTQLMVALLECAPALHARDIGPLPGAEELAAFIVASTREVISNLSRMHGGYAVLAERRIGYDERPLYVPGTSGEYYRWRFHLANLLMRQMGDEWQVDVTDGVADDVHAATRFMQLEYHGCLAGHMNVRPSGEDASAPVPPVALFSYVRQLILEEMKIHWLPEIARTDS